MVFRSAALAAALVAAVLAATPLAAAAQQAPSRLVAVLEFRNKLRGAEKEAVDAGYLADLVRSSVLEGARDVQVMTRENITVLLQSQGKRLEDCEGECEVDTGRLLGADFIVSGEVLKFGTSFKVNLKLHDTKTGRLLAGQQVSGTNIDELDRNTPPAVRRLVEPLRLTAPEQARPKARVARPPIEERPAQPQPRSEPQQPRSEPPQPRSVIGTVAAPQRPAEDVSSRAQQDRAELQGVLAYFTDPNPCRGIVVQNCNASATGLGLELNARGSTQMAGPLRLGLGLGIRYVEFSVDSSLTALASTEVSNFYLAGQVPVSLAWQDFSIGWVPYLQLKVSGDSDEDLAFRFNRFEAAYGSSFRFGIIAEAPIGDRPLMIAAGLSFEM